MVDFKKHLKKSFQGIDIIGADMASGPDQSMIVNNVDAKFVGPLMKAWGAHWVEEKGLKQEGVKKWALEYNVANMSYIIAAEMHSGDLCNVECTKDYLEDQLSTFEKPKPPKWQQMDTAFCQKACEAFLMEAFGQGENDKPVLSLVGTKGKIVLCNYAGTCSSCGINFAKQTVIMYGVPSNPATKPAAYHPGCFMRELAYKDLPNPPAPGAMRYALRSMGRTADEMRWRRRAKATCSVGVHDLTGGQDPTIPERHTWRCKCPVAPWNLTKQQRQETREKYGVKK